jgi:transposase
MGEQKRKVHSPEFKAKVGLEAIQGKKTVNEIGLAHEVHPVQVSQWKKEIQEGAVRLFETKRGRKPKETGMGEERLFGEIGRLKMGRDWPKKKSGLSR